MSDELNEMTPEELEREIAEASRVEKTEKVNQKKEPKSKPKKSTAIAKASEQASGAIATNASNLVEARSQATVTTARSGIEQAKRDAATFNKAYQATLLGELGRATQSNATSLRQQLQALDEHTDAEVDLEALYAEYGVTNPLGEEPEVAPVEAIVPFSIFG